MDISNSRDGTPTYENSDHHDNNANNHHAGHSHQGSGGGSGSLSAALPPMTSHPQNNCSAAAGASSNAAAGSGGAAPAVSTQDALKTIQTALLLTSGSVNHTRDALAAVTGHGSTISSARESPSVRGGGGGTPTHSESGNSAASQYQNSSGSNHHGHHGGHHQLHHHHQHLSHMVSSSPLTALKSQMISLTPSLSKLYKESLIGHVTAWPAESVERMAGRVNEDHNNISNLGVTKVSAELKMARSLVRLAEIQATLQEQRILFLRQQSLDLEALGTTTRSSSSSHQLHHQHSASSSMSEPNTPSKASAAASAPQLVLPAVPAPNCNQQLQQHDGAAAAAAPGNHSNSYNHQ